MMNVVNSDLFFLYGIIVILCSVKNIIGYIFTYTHEDGESLGNDLIKKALNSTAKEKIENVKYINFDFFQIIYFLNGIWAIMGLFSSEWKLFFLLVVTMTIPTIRVLKEKSIEGWGIWFWVINGFFKILITFSIIYKYFFGAL